MEEGYLQKTLLDICLGYSEVKWRDSFLYIKHLSGLDVVEISSFYQKHFEDAKNRGIPNREERLKWLVDNSLWDKAKDTEIKQQQNFLDTAKKTREKMFIKKQIEAHDKIIQEESVKLNTLINNRENLIGLTCEKIADQKIQFCYILISFFKDRELKDRFFTLDQINDMDDDDSLELLDFYINLIDKFVIEKIKKITISQFFTSNFYLCENNLYNFLGKPMFSLTHYQSNLLSYGLYFKNILSNNPNLPEDIRDDPEKIEEFVQRSSSLKENIRRVDPGAQSVGLVGASSQDLKDLGLREDRGMFKGK